MDLNDYWQENKRFLLTVGGGCVVFLVGLLALDGVLGKDLASVRRSRARLRGNMRQPMYSRADLDAVREDHDGLRDAVESLAQKVLFEAREDFLLDFSSSLPTNRYHSVVARVRDDILPLANRANMVVPQDLGLPVLSPTRGDEIDRYLHALDAIDRVLRVGIEERVARVDSIRIKLDPALASRSGTGRIERTRVELTLSGEPLSLLRLLERSQRPRRGAALLIDQVDMLPSKSKPDEAVLHLVLALVRMHEDPEAAEEGS